MGTMQAIIKEKPTRGLKLVQEDIPEPGPGEILVEVLATSICGTDVHIYQWDEWSSSRIKPPQIAGHEFAGIVKKVGKYVKNIKVGDYISAETHIPCCKCIQCLSGQMHICSNLEILGVDRNGSFAEYIVIPEIVAWKNDKSIPPFVASVQEPLGNAVYCTLVEPVNGKSIVIFGDGPTALFATAIAKASGASKIIVVGLDDFRLNIAKKVGADFIFKNVPPDSERDSIIENILNLTNGYGPDVVLEMAGAVQTVQQGLKVVRKGGRFSSFGITKVNEIPINYNNNIIFKGITLYGINGRLMFDTWIKIKNFLSNDKINIEPIITHLLPFSEFEKGFEMMMEFPKKCGKVVLVPDNKFENMKKEFENYKKNNKEEG